MPGLLKGGQSASVFRNIVLHLVVLKAKFRIDHPKEKQGIKAVQGKVRPNSLPIETAPHTIFLGAGEAIGRRRRATFTAALSSPSYASYFVVLSLYLMVLVVSNIVISSRFSVTTAPVLSSTYPPPLLAVKKSFPPSTLPEAISNRWRSPLLSLSIYHHHRSPRPPSTSCVRSSTLSPCVVDLLTIVVPSHFGIVKPRTYGSMSPSVTNCWAQHGNVEFRGLDPIKPSVLSSNFILSASLEIGFRTLNVVYGSGASHLKFLPVNIPTASYRCINVVFDYQLFFRTIAMGSKMELLFGFLHFAECDSPLYGSISSCFVRFSSFILPSSLAPGLSTSVVNVAL
ncbi:hypothetical protein F2Q70_00027895 [Brassica cretica]|uniref:Uncharacterized protein n=1 Tax=Brassica cretica TaxID=69181 RepID=A0A8S9L3H1_BRACR|nr:hypothetical protein F2Q70_00027895 [Brassica cretica]